MKINFKHINILQFTFIAIIFNLLVSINFFIKNQFFVGNSTNLTLFFAVIPFFAIILVPALCYKQSISVYDDFLPLSTTKKIIQNFFTNLLKFTILILFLIPNCLVVNFFGNIDFGKVFKRYSSMSKFKATSFVILRYFHFVVYHQRMNNLLTTVEYLYYFYINL